MCGIVGAVFSRPTPVKSGLLDPLRQLEYRGYDSCGYFATDFEESTHRRVTGDVKNLASDSSGEFVQGIAHTRWATHGAVTEENSHPHASSDRIYVVHNGVVDNYQEVKSNLVQKGYVFESDTDTEVIAHLVHFYASDFCSNGLSLSYPTAVAVCMATVDLKGKFSFVAVDAETKTMVAVNRGRPLIVFRDDEGVTIASDVAAFTGKRPGEVYYTSDGEACEINGNSQSLRSMKLGDTARYVDVVRSFRPYSPEPHPSERETMRTAMESEIFQQPAAVANTVAAESVSEISRIFSEDHAEHLKRACIVGCGTSYHAALIGARWMKSLAGVEATAHVSSEFAPQASDAEADMFFFVSQSGETADTLTALESVIQFAPHKTVAVCNVPQSEMVRCTKHSVATRAGTERSVASTKAFTCQLVALAKIALAAGTVTKRGVGSISFITDDIERAMEGLSGLIGEAVESSRASARAFAEALNPKVAPSHAVFLGRDVMHSVALEGALKLSEVAYVPSLTYFTGELKHGPLALVDEKTPVFAVFSGKEVSLSKTFSSLSQVQSRGGRVFLVSDRNGVEAAKKSGIRPVASFTFPTVSRYESVFEPILAAIPLQVLAHEFAFRLGRDVDRPRHLAKSVTVE